MFAAKRKILRPLREQSRNCANVLIVADFDWIWYISGRRLVFNTQRNQGSVYLISTREGKKWGWFFFRSSSRKFSRGSSWPLSTTVGWRATFGFAGIVGNDVFESFWTKRPTDCLFPEGSIGSVILLVSQQHWSGFWQRRQPTADVSCENQARSRKTTETRTTTEMQAFRRNEKNNITWRSPDDRGSKNLVGSGRVHPCPLLVLCRSRSHAPTSKLFFLY